MPDIAATGGKVDALMVMGVSGSGKSTVAHALAEHYGPPMIEGDDLHAPASIAKMSRGEPLDDHDRMPWLDRIAAAMVDRRDSALVPVTTCSALRRAYRDRLRRASNLSICFIFAEGTFERIAARIAHREGHLMPVSLLKNQFDILELPQPDEFYIAADLRLPKQEMLQLLFGRPAALMAR